MSTLTTLKFNDSNILDSELLSISPEVPRFRVSATEDVPETRVIAVIFKEDIVGSNLPLSGSIDKGLRVMSVCNKSAGFPGLYHSPVG
jgi:hypothetical protein